MVHELIHSYKLTASMDVVTATPATEDELRLFHSLFYLNYLKDNCNDESGVQYTDDDDDANDSDGSNVDDEQLEYGLGEWCILAFPSTFKINFFAANSSGYDCPKFANLWKFVRYIGGGSITAAKQLLNGRRIAINWCGGWHHGQRYVLECL